MLQRLTSQVSIIAPLNFHLLTSPSVNMARLANLMTTNGQGNMNPQVMANLQFTIGTRPQGSADPFKAMPMMADGAGGVAEGNPNNGNGNAMMQLQLVDGRLQFANVKRLDGEYVILIPMQGAAGQNGTKQELGFKKTNAASRDGVNWGWVFAVVASVGGILSL